MLILHTKLPDETVEGLDCWFNKKIVPTNQQTGSKVL